MNLLRTAARIAREAHAGQMDKAGRPYILHPARVARALRRAGHRDEVVAAGLLHDVVEDTRWTLGALRSAGIPDETVKIVDAVTRRPGETYPDFIERVIAFGPDARALKEYDIEDNSRPTRGAPPSPARQERYRVALARLRSARPTIRRDH